MASTFFTVLELSRISHFPTAVDPVKDTFFISGLWHIAIPTASVSSRATVMQLMTPAGTPASSAIAHSASADNGASSEGLIRTGQPAANAGPICCSANEINLVPAKIKRLWRHTLRVIIAEGKFQGVINAAGPTEVLIVRRCLPAQTIRNWPVIPNDA